MRTSRHSRPGWPEQTISHASESNLLIQNCSARKEINVPCSSRASLLLLATLTAVLGCHAQTPTPALKASQPLPLEEARRVEVLLRQKANLPPGAAMHISPPAPSEVPGYDTIEVTFSAEGTNSRPLSFLLSKDGKTLAQFNKFDISANPRSFIAAGDRPSRGGPAAAPVVIVGFDDLECPYCARLHESLFPLIVQRYGDKVHFVYKDYPLTEIHPWAMHAAVDVNCMAAESPAAYWTEVDYIHAHAGEFGADPKDAKADKTTARANEQLDALTREQGKLQKVNEAKLNECLTKQDTSVIKPMQAEGAKLNLESTPVLFINGDKIDGAVPPEFIFGVIDEALRAEGCDTAPAVRGACASGFADAGKGAGHLRPRYSADARQVAGSGSIVLSSPAQSCAARPRCSPLC